MRKCLLLFILFFSYHISQSQPIDSVRLFGREILDAFKTQDLNRYKKLVLDYDTYVKEISPKLIHDTVHRIPQSMLNNSLNFYKEKKQFQLNDTLFNTIVREATRLGIHDWSKTSFLTIDVTSNSKTDETPKIYSGDITFSYKDTVFVFYNVVFVKLRHDFKLYFIRGLSKQK